MGLFFIKGVRALINPMQIASIFRNGENWALTMSSGSTYNITEDELFELVNMMNHEGKELDKKNLKMMLELFGK